MCEVFLSVAFARQLFLFEFREHYGLKPVSPYALYQKEAPAQMAVGCCCRKRPAESPAGFHTKLLRLSICSPIMS